MKIIKSEKIAAIKKRFKNQWILIDIDLMNEKTTTPLTGRLIAHSPKRENLHKIILKSPEIKRPLVEFTGPPLPRGVAAVL